MLSDYNALALAMSGLVHYWPLSEAAGTAFADLKAANDAAAASSPGRLNGPDGSAQAPDFAATNNRVLLPGSNVTMPTTHSVMYWQLLDAASAGDMLAFEWATAAFAKTVQHDTGYSGSIGGAAGKSLYSAYYANGAAGANGGWCDRTVFGTNTWKFVVWTCDPAQAASDEGKLYLDGVQQLSTIFQTPSEQTGTAGAGVVGIGGRGQGGRNLALNGALSGFGIFDRVLTTQERADLRAAMLAAPSASAAKMFAVL